MYDEKELWNRILKTASQLNFYILLEHIFKVLEILKNNNIPSSLKHEKFLYKGISIIIPVEIYFVLCSIRFRQTFIEDEKYYFANCAIRAYNKHNKILSKYSVDEFEESFRHVNNHLHRIELFYSEDGRARVHVAVVVVACRDNTADGAHQTSVLRQLLIQGLLHLEVHLGVVPLGL